MENKKLRCLATGIELQVHGEPVTGTGDLVLTEEGQAEPAAVVSVDAMSGARTIRIVLERKAEDEPFEGVVFQTLNYF